jgi:hypothetical protein
VKGTSRSTTNRNVNIHYGTGHEIRNTLYASMQVNRINPLLMAIWYTRVKWGKEALIDRYTAAW